MRNLLISSKNLPLEFEKSMYADYDTERGDPDILEQIQDWKPSPSHPSLLLEGCPGLGKTLLACAALNEKHARYRVTKVVDKQPLTVDEQTLTMMRQKRFPVYFIQLADWLGLQHRMFRLHDEMMRCDLEPTECLEIDQLLEDLMYKVELLVVDDVGKEHRTASGFADASFDLLVRTRHNRGLATIYTSNIPLEEWSDQYSDAMQNFISRSSLILEFR